VSRQFDDFEWCEDYLVAECRGCESLTFVKERSTSDDDVVQIGYDEWEHCNSVDLYPDPIPNRSPMSSLEFLPMNVQRIYKESVRSLGVGTDVLTGIGIRAIVETVCKDRQAFGGDLYERINDLVNKQLLTPAEAGVLHKLRSMGNAAAHEVKPHDRTQLSLAMDVIEHLLSGVYVLPNRVAKAFPKP
jgi:Domain of unknown function (DUF4145)